MARTTIEYQLVDELRRAPTNSKGHDPEGIRASIARFGFVGAIVLDERTGCLIEGHGRLDELQRAHAAGETPPTQIEVDEQGRWLVPVSRGWSSVDDAEAEAYGIAANQLTIAGGWHHETLLEQLARVQQTPLQFEGLGFETDELNAMVADLSTPEVMDTSREWNTNAVVDTTVAFRFGDYSGKVQRDVYDQFLAVFERLRDENDAVMLDEVLVAWLKLNEST